MRIFRQAIEQLGNSFVRDQTPEKSPMAARSKSLEKKFFEIDKEFATPEFLFRSVNNNNNQAVENSTGVLDKLFFFNLSSCEQKMLQNFSRELVESLVNMYKQCIEFYDTKQDPIKYYFLDKIQNVISQDQAYKEIYKNQTIKKKQESNSDSQNKSDQGEIEVFHDVMNDQDSTFPLRRAKSEAFNSIKKQGQNQLRSSLELIVEQQKLQTIKDYEIRFNNLMDKVNKLQILSSEEKRLNMQLGKEKQEKIQEIIENNVEQQSLSQSQELLLNHQKFIIFLKKSLIGLINLQMINYRIKKNLCRRDLSKEIDLKRHNELKICQIILQKPQIKYFGNYFSFKDVY